MKEIECSIKVANNNNYSSNSVFECLRERRIEDERMYYEGSFYMHYGYINRESLGVFSTNGWGYNILFNPNDKEFYKGFIEYIRQSGLSEDKLYLYLPSLARNFTDSYFDYADDDRSRDIEKIYERFKKTKLSQCNYTEKEIRLMFRKHLYEVLRSKSLDSKEYIAQQRYLKHLGVGVCAEKNSSYANLLALFGYEVFVVGGDVKVNKEVSGHLYPLIRDDYDKPFSISDITLHCYGGKVNNPLNGYDIVIRNDADMVLGYFMSSFSTGGLGSGRVLR